MSVALDHLLRWVDTGMAPPRAERAIIDRNTDNDGSLLLLDAQGNPTGTIRSPYVDAPVVKYTARNTGSPGSEQGFLCNLSNFQNPFSQAELRDLYGSKDAYVSQFEASLNELEDAGWSLPVFHDLLMADAQAVDF